MYLPLTNASTEFMYKFKAWPIVPRFGLAYVPILSHKLAAVDSCRQLPRL